MAGLRLILFGFESFESKVASGLVLALRFRFEVSLEIRKFGFEFCVWGPKI